MRKVLVAVDGSECSTRAVQEVIALSGSGLAREVLLLTVVESVPPDFALFVDNKQAQRIYREQGARARARAPRGGAP